MRGNQPYFQGRAARALGAPQSACPHPTDTPLARNWLIGWEEINRSSETPIKTLESQALDVPTPPAPRPPRKSLPWLFADEELLIFLYHGGEPVREIATRLGRSHMACTVRLNRLIKTGRLERLERKLPDGVVKPQLQPSELLQLCWRQLPTATLDERMRWLASKGLVFSSHQNLSQQARKLGLVTDHRQRRCPDASVIALSMSPSTVGPKSDRNGKPCETNG